MSQMIKNGSLDFGDLKSKGDSSMISPGLHSESDKQKQTSPRSPIGRTDKRNKEKADLLEKEMQLKKKEPLKKEVPRENVKEFYFANGKPISKQQKQENELAIEKAFEGKADGVKLDDFEPIIKDVCKVPTIFKKMLFEYVKKAEKLDEKTEKIPK